MSTAMARLMIVGLFLSIPMAGFPKETKLLRYPDIHGNSIVFCYGGDLYIASSDGTQVKRLTSHPGEVMLPKFSPDGRQVAFTADWEGNKDIYAMSIPGGKPKRLTFHPAAEYVVDWHPDGKRIIFRSNGSSFTYRFNRLHAVPVQGGLPTVLDLPEADLSSFNDAGDRIAFCRVNLDTVRWKRYRGGLVPNIWVYDFKTKQAELVVDDRSVNLHPMWIGDDIYFLSDRGEAKEQNLWVFRGKSKEVSQLTSYTEWGIKWPSKGEDKIIFEIGGRLAIYDLRDGKVHDVSIEMPPPENARTEQAVDVKKYISGAPAISPDGKKLIISARGDLFYLDPERKETRNLTGTSGANERYPIWSPGGQWFAYISDISGEDQIYIQKDDGTGEPLQLTQCSESRLDNLVWSPDGTKIGYSDQRASFYVIDIDTRVTTAIFFDEHLGTVPAVFASWSPDSKWLAYSKGNSNSFHSVYLYSLADGKTYRVTDDSTHSTCPRFDPEGKYLVWIAELQKINVVDSFCGDHYFNDPSIIIAATLQKGTPSPFSAGQGRGAAEKDGTRPAFRIDTDGLGERITAVPIGSSTYTNLVALKGKLIYNSDPAKGEASVKMYDMAENKESTLVKEDVWSWAPAAQAEKLAFRMAGRVGILDIKPDQDTRNGQFDLSGLKISIDHGKEWTQMFNQAWRIQRDFFYDQKMHGVDWVATKRRYEALLPDVASRQDLTCLIEDMFSELGQSHVEISGGISPGIPEANSGVLGIDLQWDKGNRRYRIAKIYRGQNWDPDRISPLTLPGMNVREGDYLLSIDGAVLTEGTNPDSFLENKAGTPLLLAVNSKPSAEGARTVTVTPAAFSSSEGDFLRYNDWVLRNIARVNRATSGEVGYIHIPDTSIPGVESFFRYYYSQARKKALIIDVRFNSGGYPPNWMVELLNRKLEQYRRMPYGKALSQEPDPGFFGLKVCIVNEWAKSGGEMFADTFRLWKSGLILGKKTSGNLASTGGFRLVDGTVIEYPATGPQNEKGESVIENEGVSPDVEVTNPPDDEIRGRDAQLEGAIEELLKKLNSKGN
jgi:tricorn protease